MALELTREEIELLDRLCAKWEEQLPLTNLKLLSYMYREETKAKVRHADLKLIDLEILKNDFLGMNIPNIGIVKTTWELIRAIGILMGNLKL